MTGGFLCVLGGQTWAHSLIPSFPTYRTSKPHVLVHGPFGRGFPKVLSHTWSLHDPQEMGSLPKITGWTHLVRVMEPPGRHFPRDPFRAEAFGGLRGAAVAVERRGVGAEAQQLTEELRGTEARGQVQGAVLLRWGLRGLAGWWGLGSWGVAWVWCGLGWALRLVELVWGLV